MWESKTIEQEVEEKEKYLADIFQELVDINYKFSTHHIGLDRWEFPDIVLNLITPIKKRVVIKDILDYVEHSNDYMEAAGYYIGSVRIRGYKFTCNNIEFLEKSHYDELIDDFVIRYRRIKNDL